MLYSTLSVEQDTSGTYTIKFNKPDKRNALDVNILRELITCIDYVAEQKHIRTVVFRGIGPCFCAGVDIGWLNQVRSSSEEAEREGLSLIMLALYKIYSLQHTTIALVHGSAHGGGAGLLACCDIVIAEDDCLFSLGEVRLGLIPAGIGPYVTKIIGLRNAKRYFLTGEKFDARTALNIGLVHKLVSSGALEANLTRLLEEINYTAPMACKMTKEYLLGASKVELDEPLVKYSTKAFKRVLFLEEAGEGLLSFLEKRAPNWLKK